MKNISIEQSIKYGWRTVLDNFWPLAGLTFLLLVLSGLLGYLGEDNAYILFLTYIVQVVVSLIIIRVTLNVFEKNEVSFNGLGDAFNNFWNFLLGFFLYGIIVMIGCMLFIIPGIIWAIKYTFVPFLIVDKKMSISEAFKTSNKMASGVQWSLFGFWILSVLIQFAGFLCFGIGALLTIPLTWMAIVYIYKNLLKQVSDSEAVKE